MDGFNKIIIERYLARTTKSRSLYEKARKLLPDGGGGDMQCFHPYPIYAKNAEGSRLYDVDDNEYIDFFCGAGSILLGHRSTEILAAVQDAISRGIPASVAYENEIEYAHHLRKHMPSIEMIRFLPSGSEAIQAGIRIARSFTKRNKIAKFEGGYHGQAYETMVSVEPVGDTCGSEAAPHCVPWRTAMPEQFLDSVVVLPFNDIEASTSLLEKYADQIAVVLAEPALVHGGAVPATKDYLAALREVTERNGMLLLFDEVITGFRLGLGGAQEIYGIKPDLTVLGKPAGGGFPIGIIGGRSDIMDVISMSGQHEKVCVAGSLSGHSVSVAAGLALIKELEKGAYYKHVHKLASSAVEGLKIIFSEAGIPCQITGEISGFWAGFWVHFSDRPIKNARDVFAEDLIKLMEFYIGHLGRGVYMCPNGVPSISASHTMEDIDKMLEVSESVLEDMHKK